MTTKKILDKGTAERKMRRMALQVAERNSGQPLVLIGIRENGIYIAEKMAEYLRDFYNGSLELVSLSINKKSPGEIQLSELIELNNKTIILTDDVANSGRTMMYALKPLLEQYPSSIQTLALVERSYKLFPIQVDYVGMSVSTAANQNIVVEVLDGVVAGAFIN